MICETNNHLQESEFLRWFIFTNLIFPLEIIIIIIWEDGAFPVKWQWHRKTWKINIKHCSYSYIDACKILVPVCEICGYLGLSQLTTVCKASLGPRILANFWWRARVFNVLGLLYTVYNWNSLLLIHDQIICVHFLCYFKIPNKIKNDMYMQITH